MQMALSAATKLRVEMLKNCMKCDNCSLDLNTCEQLMCNTLESNNILCWRSHRCKRCAQKTTNLTCELFRWIVSLRLWDCDCMCIFSSQQFVHSQGNLFFMVHLTLNFVIEFTLVVCRWFLNNSAFILHFLTCAYRPFEFDSPYAFRFITKHNGTQCAVYSVLGLCVCVCVSRERTKEWEIVGKNERFHLWMLYLYVQFSTRINTDWKHFWVNYC